MELTKTSTTKGTPHLEANPNSPTNLDLKKPEEVDSNKLAKEKKIRKQVKERGRPSKLDVDKKHTIISRQLNNIVYHFARLLIFLHLMKNPNAQAHTLKPSKPEQEWMDEAFALMEMDVFPSLQERNKDYLLHPNSLHFMLSHNKESRSIVEYSSEQIKHYFFAFLIKRKLFTTQIHAYVSNYWPDIINLINSASNNKAKNSQPFSSKQLYRDEQSEGEEEQCREQIEEQLREDRTIAAYEIACYLKSCCELYGVRIRGGRN